MKFWYQCTKYPVNANNSVFLTKKTHEFLHFNNIMGLANLYDDGKCYYIETTNPIALAPFLKEYGFEESNGPERNFEFGLLFGHDE